MGVVGMDHQGNTCGVKAGGIRTLFLQKIRHWSVHMRKIHTALFHQTAMAQQARAAASTFFPLPNILLKSLAIEALNIGSNAVLQALETSNNFIQIGLIHKQRRVMSCANSSK